MAAFTLKRFTCTEALKAIQPQNLLALLDRYADYFRRRGVDLRDRTGVGIDYDGLVRVLVDPDESTPKRLIDDLYYVHEMATMDGMDELLAEIANMPERDRVKLDLGPEPTPADVAVQVRLKDPDLLERKHAEHYLTSKRSFEYFQSAKSKAPRFRTPSPRTLSALEEALKARFFEMKRGRIARVFVYPKRDGVWFLVRHGDPCKREGAIGDGDSSSVFYRPEKYDVLKYDQQLGELSLNAENKKIGELYREQFGLHLFGDARLFDGRGKYSLEPLRKSGPASLACGDVDGMEWVRLKEVQYYWGGPEGEIEIRKASDIYALLDRRKMSMPVRPRITRASFLVKFRDSKTPRTVTIRPSNVASYARDSDAVMVEDWLAKRRFTIDETADADSGTEAAVAYA